MSDLLTPARRERLAALAAVMLPGGEGLPGAAEVELAAEPTDRALAARPDLAAPLAAELDRAEGSPAEQVASAAEDPDRWAVLAVAVFGAYYLTPSAREAIGYQGQPVRPIAADENDGLDELLAPVRTRGPIHRG